MLKVTFIVCLFHLFISHTYALTNSCDKLDGFDTALLLKPNEWSVTSNHQCLNGLSASCTYYFTFCKIATICFNQYSACQKDTSAVNLTIIAGGATDQFYADDSTIDGFYAQFPAGPMQNISGNISCTPKFRLNFICDKEATWLTPLLANMTGNAPNPRDIKIDPKDPCYTIMDIGYPGACRNNPSSSPPPPPEHPVHGGAVFLIVLFSLAAVYFLGGILFNSLVKHRSGLHLLPHAHFWIGLPLYAIEGCRMSITCCSGKSQPSRATYESV